MPGWIRGGWPLHLDILAETFSSVLGYMQVYINISKIKNDKAMVRIWNNDIEGAIRLLRRKMGNAGVFRALKAREKYPSVSGRRKFKDRQTVRHILLKCYSVWCSVPNQG